VRPILLVSFVWPRLCVHEAGGYTHRAADRGRLDIHSAKAAAPMLTILLIIILILLLTGGGVGYSRRGRRL
jgi:hypothetical protein